MSRRVCKRCAVHCPRPPPPVTNRRKEVNTRGWIKCYSFRESRYYYYNTESNYTTWKKPFPPDVYIPPLIGNKIGKCIRIPTEVGEDSTDNDETVSEGRKQWETTSGKVVAEANNTRGRSEMPQLRRNSDKIRHGGAEVHASDSVQGKKVFMREKHAQLRNSSMMEVDASPLVETLTKYHHDNKEGSPNEGQNKRNKANEEVSATKTGQFTINLRDYDVKNPRMNPVVVLVDVIQQYRVDDSSSSSDSTSTLSSSDGSSSSASESEDESEEVGGKRIEEEEFEKGESGSIGNHADEGAAVETTVMESEREDRDEDDEELEKGYVEIEFEDDFNDEVNQQQEHKQGSEECQLTGDSHCSSGEESIECIYEQPIIKSFSEAYTLNGFSSGKCSTDKAISSPSGSPQGDPNDSEKCRFFSSLEPPKEEPMLTDFHFATLMTKRRRDEKDDDEDQVRIKRNKISTVEDCDLVIIDEDSVETDGKSVGQPLDDSADESKRDLIIDLDSVQPDFDDNDTIQCVYDGQNTDMMSINQNDSFEAESSAIDPSDFLKKNFNSDIATDPESIKQEHFKKLRVTGELADIQMTKSNIENISISLINFKKFSQSRLTAISGSHFKLESFDNENDEKAQWTHYFIPAHKGVTENSTEHGNGKSKEEFTPLLLTCRRDNDGDEYLTSGGIIKSIEMDVPKRLNLLELLERYWNSQQKDNEDSLLKSEKGCESKEDIKNHDNHENSDDELEVIEEIVDICD